MNLTERRIQIALWNRFRGLWHVAAPNYTPSNWWECDVWAVTKAMLATEYEIKISVSDFKADADKRRTTWGKVGGEWGHHPIGESKHQCMRTHQGAPSRFFYVLTKQVADAVSVPDHAGLIVVKPWGDQDLYPNAVNVTIAKPAPRLHKRPVSDADVALCRERLSYRYWTEIDRTRRLDAASATTHPQPAP